MTRLGWGAFWVLLYVASILGANIVTTVVGPVHVFWTPFLGPPGVYFAGLCFTARDFTQDYLGKRAALAAMMAGAFLSAAASPGLALASGASFFVSEMCDYVVYTPLRTSGRPVWAVAASNSIGCVVDSIVFLWLAFGSAEMLSGQVIGKLGMTAVVLPVVIWYNRRRCACGHTPVNCLNCFRRDWRWE